MSPPPPYPKTRDLGPGRAEAAPPPRGAPDPPAPPLGEPALGTGDWGAGKKNAAPKTRGPPRPPRRRSAARRLLAARDYGCSFHTQHAGLGTRGTGRPALAPRRHSRGGGLGSAPRSQAPGRGGAHRFVLPARAAGGTQIRTSAQAGGEDSDLHPLLRPLGRRRSAPPAQAAEGTRIRAPSSGGRGPTPAPLVWEGRIWLAPPARAKADEGHRAARPLPRPRGPGPARRRLPRCSSARSPRSGAPGTFLPPPQPPPSPSPAGPVPHSPRARCPSSWCRGREGARRAAGAALRSPSPAIPSPLEIPAIEESPVRARPPPPPARRSSPGVASAAPPPRGSSAKWPEEAAAAAAAAPARPTPGEAGEGEAGRGCGRGRGAPGGGLGLTARARARAPPPPPAHLPAGRPRPGLRRRGSRRTPRAGGIGSPAASPRRPLISHQRPHFVLSEPALAFERGRPVITGALPRPGAAPPRRAPVWTEGLFPAAVRADQGSLGMRLSHGPAALHGGSEAWYGGACAGYRGSVEATSDPAALRGWGRNPGAHNQGFLISGTGVPNLFGQETLRREVALRLSG